MVMKYTNFWKVTIQIIVDKCSNYLNISSILIKQIVKGEYIKLLNIIFKSLNFFDKRDIFNLLSSLS